MTDQEILNHVDYTLLKPDCSWEDIKKICEGAIASHTASVVVPPGYVRRVAEAYGDQLNIDTVAGFPLGYSTTAVKAAEVRQDIADGADEVDIVINIGDVKNGDFDKVTEEIRTLKEAAQGHILKVIIETCYLTDDEKIKLCRCVTDAGADYIKTSTGLGPAGAKIEDVLLFRENVGPGVKIKAAGGVRTREDMEMYLNAGCDRIGSSVIDALINK